MYLDYTFHVDLSRVPRPDRWGWRGKGFQADRILETQSDSYKIEFSLSSRVSPSSTRYTHCSVAEAPSCLLFRLILASPIDLCQHLHSSRCGVAVATVAFPRPSHYCHLLHGTAPPTERPVFRRVGRETGRRSQATRTWKHLQPLFLPTA